MSTATEQEVRTRTYRAGVPATAGAGARLGGGHGPSDRPGAARPGRPLPRRGLRAGRDDATAGPARRARRGGRRRRRRCRARRAGDRDAARCRTPPVLVRSPSTSRAEEPIPGGPFDLVYARLLLFHVSDPVAVIRRLWDVVAPGGHLIVHDYDLRTADVLPRWTRWRSAGASCSARSPAPDATSTPGTPSAAARQRRARGPRRRRRRRTARAAARPAARCWRPSIAACCPPQSPWA